MSFIKFLIAAGAVAIPFSASTAQEPSSSSTAARPPAAFAQCKVCHSVERNGKPGMGPNLFRVAGSVAGTKPGFAYSPAMAASRFRWDRAKLDRFLTDPKGLVPTTKMIAPGVKDPAKRKAIIDYLFTLK